MLPSFAFLSWFIRGEWARWQRRKSPVSAVVLGPGGLRLDLGGRLVPSRVVEPAEPLTDANGGEVGLRAMLRLQAEGRTFVVDALQLQRLGSDAVER